ncbi:MAG: hypothetical protein ACYDAZ_08920 [Thermoplasmataceae archaeon]
MRDQDAAKRVWRYYRKIDVAREEGWPWAKIEQHLFPELRHIVPMAGHAKRFAMAFAQIFGVQARTGEDLGLPPPPEMQKHWPRVRHTRKPQSTTQSSAVVVLH